MYKEIPGLVLYRDLGEESILYKLADIFRDKDNGLYMVLIGYWYL